MRLDRFIAKSRIIDLKSDQLDGALRELLEVCPLEEKGQLSKESLWAELLEREKTISTYLGNGVCLPHLRVPIQRPYMFAIGRAPSGLDYEGNDEYKEIRLVFLLLARENEKSYLNVLATLARLFQDQNVIDQLGSAPDLNAFRERIKRAFSGEMGVEKRRDTKFNRLILNEAAKVAKGADCSAVVVFGDTFAGGVDVGKFFTGFKAVLVTQNVTQVVENDPNLNAVIAVRSFSNNRLSQLRSAVLIGLTRGIFKYNDRLCCVGGIPQSNQFDLIVVVDVEREFETIFMQQADLLPPGVKPEVMERVLGIATELAVEGREGKPVGSLFVVGDHTTLKPFTKQLVLNPFYGYRDEDRNILNPFMDETVKELSSIDGAFIVRGDGVLESAGVLIHAPDFQDELPSGLGSRHAAANAISQAIDCLAIVVSSSTGTVTVFRQGQMLPLIERAVGRGL